MSLYRLIIIICAFLAACATGLSGEKVPAYAEGHVLVKFKAEEAQKFLRKNDKNQLGTLAARLSMPAGSYLDENLFVKWKKAKEKKNYYLSSEYSVDLGQFMYLRLPAGADPAVVAEQMRKDAIVEYAEVDHVGCAASVMPDDTHYKNQWHLTNSAVAGRIYAPQAWDLSTGSTGVIVAVLDSGCDTNQFEFAGRCVPGYDCVNGDNEPNDDTANSHGTAVSAVLLATGNNASFGAGIDWNCKLMPVKIIDSYTNTTASWMAQGINWAVANGAKVINISAGLFATNSTLSNAVVNAVTSGVVVVSVTHNAPNPRSYPGLYPFCIAVGANDSDGKKCGFSLTGTNIAIVAPGTNIYCFGVSGSFNTNGIGTSYAAPMVAGAASLICSLRPDLDCAQVRTLLCAGAMDQVSIDPADSNGWDEAYGWGVLNVYNSLVLANTAFKTYEISSDGSTVFSWACPDNASNKQPYYIEYAESMTGQWDVAANIVYSGTNAVWADASAATNPLPRYYRIMIKEFKPVY